MRREILDREAVQALILVFGLVLIFLWFNAQKKPQPQIVPTIEPTTDILSIDKLGIKVPVIFIASDREEDIESALLSGIVHLPNTALPGQIGNVYIVGHSSDYSNSPGHYSKIFSHLPEMRAEDKINIEYQGQNFVYEVLSTKIVAADDLSVESQETQGKKLMTLQTSYPIGTAHARFVVIAQLMEK